MSPPAARPVPQEACGVPRSSSEPPKWVLIVNQVWNKKPRMKRHDADVLVKNGRAAWVSYGLQLRLTAHEVNRRDAAEAAAGYEWPAGKVATVQDVLGKSCTRPVRADTQCLREPGQVIGYPRANREFRGRNEYL